MSGRDYFRLAIRGNRNVTACGPVAETPALLYEEARHENHYRSVVGLRPYTHIVGFHISATGKTRVRTDEWALPVDLVGPDAVRGWEAMVRRVVVTVRLRYEAGDTRGELRDRLESVAFGFRHDRRFRRRDLVVGAGQ